MRESLGTRLVSLCLLDSSNCVMGIHWYSNKERILHICSSFWTSYRSGTSFASGTFETPTLWQKLQDKASSLFFRWGTPLSTMVDTDVIHMIKWTRPSPSIFAHCKRSKTGRWEVLGTRLVKPIVNIFKMITFWWYYLIQLHNLLER